MALTFCNRCGRQSQEGDQSHYSGACKDAKPIHERQLPTETGEHVRCPVAGCKFKTKLQGKAENVRARFDYHLNWHVENGVVGAIDGAPVSPLQALHTAAITMGCSVEDVEAFKRVTARLMGLE